MTTRTMDSTDIMTAKEVMEFLRIKRTALQKLQKSGKLTVMGFSKFHYYLKSEVVELVLQPKDTHHTSSTKY